MTNDMSILIIGPAPRTNFESTLSKITPDKTKWLGALSWLMHYTESCGKLCQIVIISQMIVDLMFVLQLFLIINPRNSHPYIYRTTFWHPYATRCPVIWDKPSVGTLLTTENYTCFPHVSLEVNICVWYFIKLAPSKQPTRHSELFRHFKA